MKVKDFVTVREASKISDRSEEAIRRRIQEKKRTNSVKSIVRSQGNTLKDFAQRAQMTEAIDESLEEQEARRFFEEGLGLMVTRVPNATSKTPDFLIDGEKPGYVLEVKSRFDDESFLKELERGS